ncbi:hypothetical protein [Arthrobacter sp.]|uniref:hypothetical protein n=1 Tax=Arthrobacter sp. TaxID=1667 RepID=UPI003395B31F
MPTSDELKDALSAVFDSQIPNYGDYNLVFGSSRQDNVQGAPGGGTGRCYVLGYRWRPQELVIAPFDGTDLTAGGIPVAINMTNLSHAVQLGGGEYEVGTSTGKTFRFGVQAEGKLPGEGRTIDQSEDQPDFHSFMAELIFRA